MKLFLALLMAMLGLETTAELRFEPYAIPQRNGDPIAAEVATLTVPSLRSVPGSPTFDLAVVRLRSTSDTPGDPIIFLAGGPGNSGTSYASSAAVRLLRTAGDVVLFDQRGTGRSTPRPICRMADALDPAVVYSREAATTEGLRALVRGCASDWAAKGVDIRAFTTVENADDVDALREALGSKKVNLVGFSYGTHLLFSVLRRHGAHVGRAVFLGSEGPGDTWKYPETFDLQLMKLSHMATGSDAMVRSFDRVMHQLDEKPLAVPVRLKDDAPVIEVQVSRFGLERILIQDLGDSSDFVLFPAMLQMLEQGDTRLLARYVEKRYRAMAAGIPLMSLAMDCASGASPERLADIVRQRPGSRFPRINYPYPDVCGAVGVPDLGESFRSTVSSPVPSLFVSGSLDCQTPPYQAEHARWGFTDSWHLIVENAGHEDLDSNAQVGMAIVEFFRGRGAKSGTIEMARPKFQTVQEVSQRLK